MYRNSLLHGETDQIPVTSKRAYTRRKKDHLAGKRFQFSTTLKSTFDVYIYGVTLFSKNN